MASPVAEFTDASSQKKTIDYLGIRSTELLIQPYRSGTMSRALGYGGRPGFNTLARR